MTGAELEGGCGEVAWRRNRSGGCESWGSSEASAGVSAGGAGRSGAVIGGADCLAGSYIGSMKFGFDVWVRRWGTRGAHSPVTVARILAGWR